MKDFRKRLVLLLGLVLLGALSAAQTASGTHPRPIGATPITASLALAYNACMNSAPPANEQHGGPLAGLSCNPPAQASNFLTVGTGDAWLGTVPNSVGSVRYDARTISPEDILIDVSTTDVRCQGNSVVGFCNQANTDNANVPDYSGELNVTQTVRYTDPYNGPIGSCGACTDPATLVDLTFPITATCATTADGTIGSTCSISTTWNAIIPSVIQDSKRLIAEIQTINVQDGGPDGTVSTSTGNMLFETQGIFVP